MSNVLDYFTDHKTIRQGFRLLLLLEFEEEEARMLPSLKDCKGEDLSHPCLVVRRRFLVQ